MSNTQTFGIARNTFFIGNDQLFLKHICPPVFLGGPIDPVAPNRILNLSLMHRFDLRLPDSVANMVGTNQLPMWIIENEAEDAEIRRAFPSPLLRMVEGEVIHARVASQKNTHTIHWHGIEPTPMNDGVGKHSFEIDETAYFVYQFQANQAGTYFYHCHKNTPLHFEMGLYGGLIIDPPAPPDSGLVAPYTTGGPGFVAGRLPSQSAPDVIRYDQEKIWVADDIDSRWHFPEPHHQHAMPNCDLDDPANPDNFYKFGSGPLDLNNFQQNIFTVSGVVMDAAAGPPFVGGIDDPAIRIDATVGQTVLLRYVNASYAIQEVTLPMDVTIVAWDGRPLGLPGFHRFSYPYVVPAGTPIRTTSARRFEAIINAWTPVVGVAHIRYYQWIKGVPDGLVGHVQIPVNIL